MRGLLAALAPCAAAVVTACHAAGRACEIDGEVCHFTEAEVTRAPLESEGVDGVTVTLRDDEGRWCIYGVGSAPPGVDTLEVHVLWTPAQFAPVGPHGLAQAWVFDGGCDATPRFEDAAFQLTSGDIVLSEKKVEVESAIGTTWDGALRGHLLDSVPVSGR